MEDSKRFYDEKLGMPIPVDTRQTIDSLKERIRVATLPPIPPNGPHPSGLNRAQRRRGKARAEDILTKHEFAVIGVK